MPLRDRIVYVGHATVLIELDRVRLLTDPVLGAWVGPLRRHGPMPVCAATEGLDVTTHSEALDAYRRQIVELLLAERNHVCSVCVANGNCELQDLAVGMELHHVRYEHQAPALSLDRGPDAADVPPCPVCGGRMWDNRSNKRNPRAPDFKCRDRGCDGVVWHAREKAV